MIQIPEVTDLDMAFGGGVDKILPAWKDIPQEFHRDNPFSNAAERLFFSGGKLSDHGLKPKEGVDEAKVYRILRALLGSFAPKHEHKISGVGYLLSQWYDHAKAAKKAA